jgi:hypothetical protein
MLEIEVRGSKIFVKKGKLTFSGDPLEVSCDNSYFVVLSTCAACPEEDFSFTLDVYHNTELSVPLIIINSHYRIPLYRWFRFKNVNIEVKKKIILRRYNYG